MEEIRTEEVSQHGEGSDAETTKGSRRGNVAVEFVDHGFLTMAAHDHLLLLELLGHVLGAGARHLDPGLGEEGARAQHEDNVKHGVDGILRHVPKGLRRRQVVAQASDGVGTGWATASNILRRRRNSQVTPKGFKSSFPPEEQCLLPDRQASS